MFDSLKFVLLLLLATMTAGCEREVTSDQTPGEYLFFLKSSSTLQDQTYIFIFDNSDALKTYISYNSTQNYTSILELPTGSYYVVAIANTNLDLSESIDLKDIYFSELLESLKDEAMFESTLCGISEFEVSGDGSSQEVIVDVVESVYSLDLPCATLVITTPSDQPSDYNESKAISDYASLLQLRTTIELIRDGSTIFRQSYFINEEGEEDDGSNYTKEIFLREGSYSVLVWCDYVESLDSDYHYNTSNLSGVEIRSSDLYTANSDYRDIFAGVATINITGDNNDASEDIEMYRPTAKYTIVSNDVESYNKTGGADLSELQIKVSYNGYLPSAYSVSTNKLTNAALGYAYSSICSDIDDKSATIAKDFIMVANGGESSVTLSITVSDGDSGEVINQFSNINVKYKAGYHTTITGNFLTQNDGGFTLEQEWDGSYNITF